MNNTIITIHSNTVVSGQAVQLYMMLGLKLAVAISALGCASDGECNDSITVDI